MRFARFEGKGHSFFAKKAGPDKKKILPSTGRSGRERRPVGFMRRK